jgi:hypothetical protein
VVGRSSSTILWSRVRQAQTCRTSFATDTSSHLTLIPHSQLPGQEEQALSSRATSAGSWRGAMMIVRLPLAVPLEAAFADDPKTRIYVLCLHWVASIQRVVTREIKLQTAL